MKNPVKNFLGITAWLALYGEIVYVQVIKPGMEIPENLRVYASKVLLRNLD